MPEFAPRALQAEIVRGLQSRGIDRRDVEQTVTPRLSAGRPHRSLPRHADRWVATCPACPGAEIIPADGPFVCGSCGTSAPVDRTTMGDA